MTQSRKALADAVEQGIIQADVALLNEHNCSDETMSVMATEHAARVEALSKMVEPSLGRALLLTVAGALLAAAKQIDAATVQLPELTHA